MCKLIYVVGLASILLASTLGAQAPAAKKEPAKKEPGKTEPAKKDPDYLIFTNGEKLIGEFESSTPKTVTFQSAMLGEVTVAWTKVKEIHASEPFAVIPKDMKLHNEDEAKAVPQGPVTVADKNIEITTKPGTPPRKVTIADTGYIVDKDTFDDAFESPGIFGNWTGSVTLGTSFVVATQNSTTLTGDFNMVRTVPDVEWLGPSNRTVLISAPHIPGAGPLSQRTRARSRRSSIRPMRSATNTSIRASLALGR